MEREELRVKRIHRTNPSSELPQPYKTMDATWRLFFKKDIDYPLLTEEEYYLAFGIVLDVDTDEWVVSDKAKIEKAYTKAAETRNFEIDKFWTRAAYFWGFIVLTMGGYISLITADNNTNALSQNVDLYLLLMGVIVTVSWMLSIRGSKIWQENWEQHVGKLEPFVTGPLYDIIYYPGRRYYSVSKLNSTIAFMILVIWMILLCQNLSHYRWTGKLEHINVPIALAAAIAICISLLFGYTKGTFHSIGGKRGFLRK